jgi:hypothetical protein
MSYDPMKVRKLLELELIYLQMQQEIIHLAFNYVKMYLPVNLLSVVTTLSFENDEV